MKLTNLDIPSQVVFNVHRYSRNFRATQPGSAVGGEYEDYLRAALASTLPLDLISSRRDLGMGQGLSSRSGLKHELDLVVRFRSSYFVFELKHYAQNYITKDMLLVFNQKVLDFYLENYQLLQPLKLYRVFVTRSAHIDESIRQFCALWGILLVDQELFSPPICQIVLNTLAEAICTKPRTTTWQIHNSGAISNERNTPVQLETLTKQSAALTAKLWRELGMLWNPQARLPGREFVGGAHLPPAYITKRWVTQHRELAFQTQTLKTRYENERWKTNLGQAQQQERGQLNG